MSLPSSRTVPAVASSSRRTQRPTVVLPEPLSPTSPSVSPRSSAKDTSRTATRFSPLPIGKILVRPRTSSSAVIRGVRFVDAARPDAPAGSSGARGGRACLPVVRLEPPGRVPQIVDDAAPRQRGIARLEAGQRRRVGLVTLEQPDLGAAALGEGLQQ